MKSFILFSLLTTWQGFAFGQYPNRFIWEYEAETNKRLLPKYGHLSKTDEEIKSDLKFVNETMQLPQFNNDRRAASNHMIKLGFSYLYKTDLKTAMYRFNQAYLLDSTNTDIYWGFGAVYMALGNFVGARKQYLEGLSIDPLSTHLLTDYGTYFLNEYYEWLKVREDPTSHQKAVNNLDSAVVYLLRSYRLDSKDVNTVYKLSICYWNTDNLFYAIRIFKNGCVSGQLKTIHYKV